MAKENPKPSDAAAKPSIALAVISVNDYAILDPSKNVGDLMAANLFNEDISEFDLDQIKVPSGGGLAWTVPTLEGERAAEAVEGIIVGVGKRRAFWLKQDPSGDPPDCSSRDMLNGIGKPGGECTKCPNNAFGSAKNGHGKACKETRTVFLVRASDQLPVVISVPPSSLQNFKQFMLRLPVPYWQAVTRFTLTKVQNADRISYSEIKFAMVSTLPQEAFDRMKIYADNLKKSFG